MKQTISLPEAAKLATTSATTVRRWIQSGHLQAIKNSDGNWILDSETFATFLANMKPRFGAAVIAGSEGLPSAFVRSTETTKVLQESLDRERKLNDELRDENKILRVKNEALQEEIKQILLTIAAPKQPKEQVNTVTENLQDEPKTEFGKRCYELFRENKTDEEIAEKLQKPLQNVKMALRKYRHST